MPSVAVPRCLPPHNSYKTLKRIHKLLFSVSLSTYVIESAQLGSNLISV